MIKEHTKNAKLKKEYNAVLGKCKLLKDHVINLGE